MSEAERQNVPPRPVGRLEHRGLHEHFSVDTGLFRELGELLVGRDSTALVELIKNAYDADATLVTVVAHDLDDPDNGLIVVSDDGNGMTVDVFRRGFLRVASRLKADGDRRSPLFRRRFTGAKGIGRLAAHKLARDLSVESRAAGDPDETRSRGPVIDRLRATIDWDEVERHDTLEEVGDAIVVRREDIGPADSPGTTIRLRSLRRAWTERERTRFVREVTTFQPGDAFCRAIAPLYVDRGLLFDAPKTRDADADSGFTVTLGGEFDVGEDYSVSVLAAASWVLEIDAMPEKVRYAVAPTRAYADLKDLPFAPIHAEMDREGHGASFQARIFVRAGAAPKGLADAYGVRLYMEGFRVLPYGEPGDDWLDVNRRYARRGRAIPFRGEFDDARLAEVADAEAGLVATPLSGIFGGVFLTEAGAPELRMLVNREGFVPDATFDEIAETVSNGLALQTRISAALRPQRSDRSAPAVGPATDEREAPRVVRDSLATAVELIQSVAAQQELGVETREQLRAVEADLERAHETVIDEQAMLRVLASLGTQTAAFVHEINAALGSVTSLKRLVDEMLQGPPRASQIADLQRRVDALQRTLERQSAYLVEVVSVDARRRRSRRRYAEHFEIAALVFRDATERQEIAVRNEIPRDLKTPPMFPAEVASIFTNLLSNAIKAAGRGGRIEARGAVSDGRARIVVENTGMAVRLAEAEGWFDAYRSTTAVVDPSLGQGMGLGLTITRAMLAEYRGTIQFIEPSPQFATAVEVSLPA